MGIYFLILGIGLFILVTGLNWYNTYHIINNNLLRAYISSVHNGFDGDIDDFIYHFYCMDLIDTAILCGLSLLFLFTLIVFINNSLVLDVKMRKFFRMRSFGLSEKY